MMENETGGIRAFLNQNKPYIIGAVVGGLFVFLAMKLRGKNNGK